MRWSDRSTIYLAWLLLLSCRGIAVGEPQPTDATKEREAAAAAAQAAVARMIASGGMPVPAPTPRPLPQVTNAFVMYSKDGSVGAGDWLVIEVDHMSNVFTATTATMPVPVLDGIPLAGIEGRVPDRNGQQIRFFLNRTKVNREAFNQLLSGDGLDSKRVSISAGWPGSAPWPTQASLQYRRLTETKARRLGVAYACYFLASVVIAFRSNFLRDPLPAALRVGDFATGKRRPPFSLAKVQMFLWTSVIFGAFLLVYAVTGDFGATPSSVFILLGVSGATSAGVLIPDSLKSLGLPPPATPEATPFRVEGGRVVKGWFLWDLLSNADGLNWNRTQMLFWTVVLVVIFVRETMVTLAMPEFSDSLLALMGISSGSYVLGMSAEKSSIQQ